MENLRILCPNCHSQTDTYCNCKIKSSLSDLRKEHFDNRKYIENRCIEIRIKENDDIKNKKYFCECGTEIKKLSQRCRTCDKIEQRKIKNRPTLEILLEDIKGNSYLEVGRKYNVSDNSIRKWIKSYGVIPPKKFKNDRIWKK